MARLVHDKLQDRTFETGVEKGVLYVGHRGGPKLGYAWNGLISVTDSYVNGDVESRYQDGLKIYNKVPTLEFESEIAAFTYPDEFERCLGIAEVHDGMYIDEQDREPFGLAYQTKNGNASKGMGVGFKIHLIYNAIATPNSVTRATIGDTSEPTNFSWTVKTTPVDVPGYQPTSHFTLDPSRLGPRLFTHIYDTLYGSPGVTPKLLYPQEIIDIAGDWQVLYPSTTTYPSNSTYIGGP